MLTIVVTVIMIGALQLLSLTIQVNNMSARTDSLRSAIVGLSATVDAATAAIVDLRAHQADPGDIAAVEAAVADIAAATAKLAAAIS